MAYRFKLDEPVQRGVRRILLEQIAFAEKQLGGSRARPEAIHDARKAFKRIRALLRLVRPGIGERAFRAENAAVREIAGLLASSRDRHVLQQTVGKLAEKDDARLAVALATLRTALAAAGDSAEQASGAGKLVRDARARLVKARKRLAGLKMRPKGFDPIARGVRRTHAEATKAMSRALAGGSDEAWHDWRKGAQRHWRQMQLLSRAWPEYFEVRIATAKAVSQLLGDDHDLSMLIAFADDATRSGLSEEQAAVVAAACRDLQSQLRREATLQGRRLYAESPKSLARHVTALWIDAARTHPGKAGASTTRVADMLDDPGDPRD